MMMLANIECSGGSSGDKRALAKHGRRGIIVVLPAAGGIGTGE